MIYIAVQHRATEERNSHDIVTMPQHDVNNIVRNNIV